VFNSQRGISYTPSGRNSKAAYLRRQAEAAKLAEQVKLETEQAYEQYAPAQVFHQEAMRDADFIATFGLGIDLTVRAA
jgi:hypothetical protein